MSDLTAIELVVDPLQISTLNAFSKHIDSICAKTVDIDSAEATENPIEEISKTIIKDFTEDGAKDEDIRKTINEIRKGLNIDNLVTSTDSIGGFVPKQNLVFDFEFQLKMMSLTVIHDWSNSNRLYDRVFEAYYFFEKNHTCGLKAQSDICIPGSHFLFELRDLKLKGSYSHNAYLKMSINELALYDYVLSDWKLPSTKELKTGFKNSANLTQKLINTMTEKDLKRKSEIRKICKSGFKRSSIRQKQHKGSFITARGSIGHIDDMKESNYETAYDQEVDDDNESFKSFAMELPQASQSEMSSLIEESKFMDAFDNADIWFLNSQNQHFSAIPILTIKSFETIKNLT